MTTKAKTHSDFNGSALRTIPIELIDVPEYQRTRMERWAQDIADNWDSHLFRHPYLNPRPDGRYDVIDGQHTIVGAERRGHTEIPAFVLESISDQAAAGVFSDTNTRRRRLYPYNVWNSDRAAGRRWALELERVCLNHGLVVAPASGPDSLRCIAQARTILERYGADLLDEALGVLTETWDGGEPENASRVEQGLVLGMCDLIHRAQAAGDYDRAKFVKKLDQAKYRRYGVTVRLTPKSFGGSYMPHLVENGLLPMPVLKGSGQDKAYGKAFAIAIFGNDGARRLYS